jgi:CRISPR-associated protein Cmr3
MTTYFFVEPVDSLFVRGSQAFGEGGEHGVAPALPAPSVFAGAFRSAMLAADPSALAAFDSGRYSAVTNARLAAALGSPAEPGTFRLRWCSLAGRRRQDVDALLGLPFDLRAFTHRGEAQRREFDLARVEARELPAGCFNSNGLPKQAVLVSPRQDKPVSGVLMHGTGLETYVRGSVPSVTRLERMSDVLVRDPRLGIGLDASAGTAANGQLYTLEGLAFSPSALVGGSRFDATGYLIGIDGADDLLPAYGWLRLGGDGRAARFERVLKTVPSPDLDRIVRERRFRVVTTTPLVVQGSPAGHVPWAPPGVRGDGMAWKVEGLSARLVCTALPRHETVGGWDMVTRGPKPSLRAVPAGAVFWFDEFEGDVRKLAAWVERGLCAEDARMTPRRAEGFGNALLCNDWQP